MTSRCTHEQCNMINNEGVTTEGTIRCGCHGSHFDRFGVPFEGPAMSVLPHFHVIVNDDGLIGADFDEPVDVDFRAPVP